MPNPIFIIFKKIFCCLLLLNIFIYEASARNLRSTTTKNSQEKSFVFIIPAYNAKEWYKLNLDSIFRQDYSNYRIIYVDDSSTDGTAELVKDYIEKTQQEHRFTLIKNNQRCLQLLNRYKAIHTCKNDEIIFILDADDLLPHSQVLSKLNKIYQNSPTWLTYGQMQIWCNQCLTISPTGFAQANKKPTCKHSKGAISTTPPGWVTLGNKFRDYPRFFDHPSTFYAWLYKQIKLEDLLFEGKPFPVSTDLAIMYPMLEMAGKHAVCVEEVLYFYNKGTPLNCSNIYPKIVIHGKKGSYYGETICKKERYSPCATPIIKTSRENEKIVAFIISDDSIGLKKQLTDLGKFLPELAHLYVFYPAEEEDVEKKCQEHSKNYPNISAHNITSSTIIHDLANTLIQKSQASYFLIIFNGNSIKSKIPLKECIKKLESTFASTCCIMPALFTTNDPLMSIDKFFHVWQPAYNKEINAPNAALYQTSMLKKSNSPFATTSIPSSDEISAKWAIWRPVTGNGICIAYTTQEQHTRLIG